MILEFSIPGPPHPQGRPRSTVRGKQAHVYEDKKDRSWKGVAMNFMQLSILNRGGEFPIPGPIGVELIFHFALPQSKHRKKMPRKQTYHVGGRFDLDNLCKSALDAGNGILWGDDSQVAVMKATKYIAAQGKAPGTFVRVWTL